MAKTQEHCDMLLINITQIICCNFRILLVLFQFLFSFNQKEEKYFMLTLVFWKFKKYG